MVLNKLFDVVAFFHLGQRYLRTLQRDRNAIKCNRAEYYARVWEDAAAQTGSTIELLGNGIFKITNNGHSVLVFEQYTPFTDFVGYQLVVNKAIIYKLLTKINVPIPRYIHFKKLDVSAAKSFMSEVDCPLVIKPAYGTGAGAGVTTNVTGVRRLYQALAWSRAFCPETVIEEQIKGDNYRLLFLDGELLDCIVRRPPTVIGDGVSSIRRLIRQENKKRIEPGSLLAQSLIYIDLDTKNTLAAQGMNLSTTPVNGQVIKVKDVINCNRAEENESPPQRPAKSLISLGQKISETIGVRLIGIDIITNDLTVDLQESGGRVIEVNTPPGHFYHHLKKGEGYPVGLRILQQIFKK
jgi:D-alanine-D-alanine ligase-like ATP-grasp enzyme